MSSSQFVSIPSTARILSYRPRRVPPPQGSGPQRLVTAVGSTFLGFKHPQTQGQKIMLIVIHSLTFTENKNLMNIKHQLFPSLYGLLKSS
jgi:hypothetical protein